MNRLLNKLDRKIGKYAPPNIIFFVVASMFAVFIVEKFVTNFSLTYYMFFSSELVMRGEVWRVITYALLPPTQSILWILVSLCVYFFIGSSLEERWGSFKFNVYYFTGVLLTAAGGFITGSTTNEYIYFSMFFAFAVLYPDCQFRVFFMFPIEVKWLALIDLGYFVYSFVVSSWSGRIAIIISLANFILFFYEDFFNFCKREYKFIKHKINNRGKWK